MIWPGPYVRAGAAWVLASAAMALAFTKFADGSSREVLEFLVLFVFDLCFTALLGFLVYSCSRWFVISQDDDDSSEAAASTFAISMVTLAVASLSYWLLVVK